jgi:hypothetical protein
MKQKQLAWQRHPAMMRALADSTLVIIVIILIIITVVVVINLVFIVITINLII